MAVSGSMEKAVADLFTMLDRNKDGVIDEAEQEQAMKNIHSMTLPKARWTWSSMDTNGDRKISEKEFQEGMQAIFDKVGTKQMLDCIIRAWPDHPLALEKAKEEREVVLAAVAQHGFALQDANVSLKKDKKVVLAAVAQDGRALAYADESLKKDKEVVLAAVAQDGEAIYYAFESLKKDKEVVLAAVAQYGWALEYADESLKKDKEFVLAAVAQNGEALGYADESLWEDEELLAAGGYVEEEEEE